MENAVWTLWSTADARACIRLPAPQDHKYTRGVLGVVTGSRQYPGAAVLTTAAASATGLGMVRFYPTAALAALVLQRSPEVVVAPGPVHAWLLGSGVGPPGGASFAHWLRHRQIARAGLRAVPTVLDAGALHLAGTLGVPTVITPHAGELAALLQARGVAVSSQEIAADPQVWALRAHRMCAVTVLLKGAQTVVAGQGVCIRLLAATPWLATAGTGDVLAGIAGALVAGRHAELAGNPALLGQLAATAAFIHARAADLACDGAPITASGLIAAIAPAVGSLFP